MAASLLDGYNWADLSAEEMTTAVKALAIATQERFVVSNVNQVGAFRTTGTPSPDDYKAIFPYKTNTNHKWPLNDGDPLPDLTDDVEQLLIFCSQKFADIEKWDDADTNGETATTRYLYSDAADVPATYDNRLFEVTGYTSWPDLSVYDKREVKKWYDMVTTLKYVRYDVGPGTNQYSIFNGLFEMNNEPFYNTDDDYGRGARWYAPSSASSSTLEDPATTTPYSDFKTDNNALFSTTVDSFNEDTDTPGTYPPDNFDIFSARFRRDSSGDYACYIRTYNATRVQDWGAIISGVGLTGKPLLYKNQFAVEFTESFPTGEDTNLPRPATTTADDERYYTTVTLTRVGDEDKLAVNPDLGPPTFPTNLTDIAASENVSVKISQNTNLEVTFLGDWDGDGGFDYYTP